MAIKEPVDQMKIAWPAASCTDCDRPREMSFCSRGESRHFFVADMNPLDLTLFANGVRETVEAIANDSIDAFDPGGGEDRRKLFSNVRHIGFSV
jgi:hypothetical protein